jgi:hypothetical protein
METPRKEASSESIQLGSGASNEGAAVLQDGSPR